MKRSRTFPENRLALFAIGLLTAVLLSGAISPAIAGDEDGVAGYKFKIYDEDGDGIDGNEYAGPNGATLSSTVVVSDVRHSELVVIERYLCDLVIWWFTR